MRQRRCTINWGLAAFLVYVFFLVFRSLGMAHLSAEKIAQRAFNLGLLDERQLQEVWASLGSRSVGTKELVQTLLRREFLTNYQVERLLKGDRTGFFYGNYKVLYHVGAGTFARVFRAVHRETGNVVAIKVLRNRFCDDAAKAEQFVREGRVGCALRHPNIVPIYEVFSEGKTHFLVMEFVEGRNLQEFVRVRKRLEYVEATRLMMGIADGLQYAFENGLTHRDLKMNNVLVSSRGEAKLVDFGLAALDENISDDFQVDTPNARTIDYAALERITGVRKDDTRSDVYFLGCMYYHMLVGKPPLSETRDRGKRLSKTRFLNVLPIRKADATVPDGIALVVSKAMMLDPTKRYQSPGAMLHDLRLADKRMQKSPPPTRADIEQQAAEESAARSAVAESETRQPVMVVESNTAMQDIFRDALKKAGYRALITGDPGRAHSRLRQDLNTADCVIFNAQELGKAALKGFNDFGQDSRTKTVPTVLLLDEKQRAWARLAVELGEHRVILPMPITMKRLRDVLTKLVGQTPAEA